MAQHRFHPETTKPAKTPKIPNRQKSQKPPKTSAKNPSRKKSAKNFRPPKISATT
jgi:hypothetical protein